MLDKSKPPRMVIIAYKGPEYRPFECIFKYRHMCTPCEFIGSRCSKDVANVKIHLDKAVGEPTRNGLPQSVVAQHTPCILHNVIGQGATAQPCHNIVCKLCDKSKGCGCRKTKGLGEYDFRCTETPLRPAFRARGNRLGCIPGRPGRWGT